MSDASNKLTQSTSELHDLAKQFHNKVAEVKQNAEAVVSEAIADAQSVEVAGEQPAAQIAEPDTEAAGTAPETATSSVNA